MAVGIWCYASEMAPAFLYLSLAIIVCGYGLFKSNVSCLLGELYQPEDPRRDGGFSLLYAAGNIGSIIAPIACGYVQEEYSWAMGFALAAIGMLAGLVIFLCGNRHFAHTTGVNKAVLRAKKIHVAELGTVVSSAGCRPTADYCLVLERVVRVRPDRCYCYRSGGSGEDLPPRKPRSNAKSWGSSSR